MIVGNSVILQLYQGGTFGGCIALLAAVSSFRERNRTIFSSQGLPLPNETQLQCLAEIDALSDLSSFGLNNDVVTLSC